MPREADEFDSEILSLREEQGPSEVVESSSVEYAGLTPGKVHRAIFWPFVWHLSFDMTRTWS
jgi:hypothetical protein